MLDQLKTTELNQLNWQLYKQLHKQLVWQLYEQINEQLHVPLGEQLGIQYRELDDQLSRQSVTPLNS
jgi:hypothetical protein